MIGLFHKIQSYRTHAQADTSTKTFSFCDPLSYQASTCNDPDLSGYVDVLSGPDQESFHEGMQKEMKEPGKKNMWTPVLCSEMKKRGRKALPCAWRFCCKSFPDGSICKLKACLCAQEDCQDQGVDFFESYAPVVHWTTIHLILIISIVLN